MSEEYHKVFKGKYGSYDRYPRGENDKILAAIGYPIPLVALIALLAVKPLSPYLRFHSIQALGLGIAAMVLWIVGGALTAVFIGCLIAPIGFLIWIYALVIMIMIFTDKDHRVPMIADWVEKTFV